MYFDPVTLIVSAVLTIIMVGLTLAALFRHTQSSARVGYWWMGTFVLTAAGFVCIGMMSGSHPGLRVLMNMAFLTGYACAYNGARTLAGRPAILWPVAAALCGWPLFIWALTPDLDLRAAIFSLIVLAYTTACGSEFYRGAAPHEHSRRIAALVCGFHACFYAVRAILGPSFGILDNGDSETMRFWGAIVSLEALPFTAILAILVICISHEQIAFREKTIANTDYLTGIGNRRAFEKLFADFLADKRSAKRAHLLLLDLDNFKMVNDQFGHAAGDELLREFAEILLETVPNRRHFWRLGGDEFAILVEHSTDDLAHATARAVRDAAAAAPGFVRLRSHIPLGVSIGIAPISDGCNLSQILRAADAALYREKSPPAATAYALW